jgi:hypothetical protein
VEEAHWLQRAALTHIVRRELDHTAALKRQAWDWELKE